MQQEFSISEAIRKLPTILNQIESGGMPISLTRRGKSVAMVVSIQEYERLHRKKEDFWDVFISFRQALEKENIEFSDSDFENLRDTSSGREVSLL